MLLIWGNEESGKDMTIIRKPYNYQTRNFEPNLEYSKYSTSYKYNFFFKIVILSGYSELVNFAVSVNWPTCWISSVEVLECCQAASWYCLVLRICQTLKNKDKCKISCTNNPRHKTGISTKKTCRHPELEWKIKDLYSP